MFRRVITGPLIVVCVLVSGLVAQAQQRAYHGTYQSVRQVILRLENRANLLRNSMEDWTSRSTPAYSSTENINQTVRDFNDSVRRLRDRFDRRQATTYEVQDVLSRAGHIDDFVNHNSLDTRTQNQWTTIRTDLNSLARAYNLTWQDSTSNLPPYANQNR